MKRAGGNLKRVPLSRIPREPGARQRRAPLAAREPETKSAPRRKGGGGPTPKVRRLVLERDGYRCVCCGRSVIGQRYSLGHRLRASQGGKPVPSNLLVFLGWGGEACHGRIDSRRDPHDEARGYTVRSWQDPAMVPVMVTSEYGARVTVWLTEAGTYAFEAPAVAS